VTYQTQRLVSGSCDHCIVVTLFPVPQVVEGTDVEAKLRGTAKQNLGAGGGGTMVGFDVFTAVTMKNTVFWDVTPCRSCKNRRIGGN
jgi:hypothetical protein